MPNANGTEQTVRKMTLRVPEGLALWIDSQVEEQQQAFNEGRSSVGGTQQNFFMQLVLKAKEQAERENKTAGNSRKTGTRGRTKRRQAA